MAQPGKSIQIVAQGQFTWQRSLSNTFMRIILVILILYFSTIGWMWKESIASKDNKARSFYKEGKIDEALKEWKDAQIDKPDNNELQYNIGNALHELGKHEDAFKEYEKSLASKNNALNEKTYYNMGNTSFRMGKPEEAIKHYEKALSIDPNDEDAKYNIEFIKKLLEKQKEGSKSKDSEDKPSKEERSDNKDKLSKEEKDKEDGEDSKPGEDSKELSEENASGEKDKDSAKDDKAEKEAEQNKEKAIEEKSSSEDDSEGKKEGMSKQDALRILDAMEDDELEVQKGLKNRREDIRYNVEKDW